MDPVIHSDSAARLLPLLLGIAWLLPLVSFALICIVASIPQLFGRRIEAGGKFGGYLATLAIVSACGLSMFALFLVWLPAHPLAGDSHAEGGHAEPGHATEADSAALERAAPERTAAVLVRGQSPETAGDEARHGDAEHGDADHGDADGHGKEGHGGDGHGADDHGADGHGSGDHAGHGHHAQPLPVAYSGDWYSLGVFGRLQITIGYYIDALTVAMFCMVTLIASCIHFYAMGYMHEELHDVTDHEVTLSNGEHLHRPGRYHRFFQYLSLFCFSMLGLVIAGNIAMVFVFWELVGICSYFLIGFYIERHSASTAANKAFIVNRVGDFGMIIGLMAIWSTLGTFNFADSVSPEGAVQPGIFSQLRPASADYALQVPDAMVQASAAEEVGEINRQYLLAENDAAAAEAAIEAETPGWREAGYGYWLLVIAGLGIFCGCIGKSAQFPLHVWLPDAMEGPTPVSALVHSATMVAAGVYLVGRFFPVFTPEVLLVISYVGCITLFIAATIAITATDIKRVLAYSTVSQLGYMMLALGLGGWLAGMFHLFTHAFFKSLLFMCSGSVIHAVHSNEMTDMGGLLKKMPYTAITMLFGCLAIIGAGIPFIVGFAGYYSKDAILEQALSHSRVNPSHGLFFAAAAGGAAITAFYMFRMWFMTFLGKPRDAHRYEHAHESPATMVYPLVLLAAFALGAGWTLPSWAPGVLQNLGIATLLEEARPAGTLATAGSGALLPNVVIPNEHDSHVAEIKTPATLVAFSTAMAGLLLACVIYWWRLLDADEIRRQFHRLHRFLVHKWWFDELYQAIFVAPTLFIGRRIAQFDRVVIDGVIHGAARITKLGAWVVDVIGDRFLVDGTVNGVAHKTWDLGLNLHKVQTGRLRQYVMFIVVGTVALFVLISFVWSLAVAG